jgi:ubiquitin C-terminal hydrolase
MEKECFKCKEVKCLSQFYNQKQLKDNKSKKCKECTRKERTIKRPAYIYVISHPKFKGWVKIGRAIDVNKRLDSYQTGCPNREYKLEYHILVDDPFLYEYYFSSVKKSNGYEWFNIEIAEAIHTIEDLNNEKHKLLNYR